MADETKTQETESMNDYKDELEASFRKLSEGDIVSGTVIAVTEDDVTLDLWLRSSSAFSRAITFAERTNFFLLSSIDTEAEEINKSVMAFSSNESASTSLASLLKNIKLDN